MEDEWQWWDFAVHTSDWARLKQTHDAIDLYLSLEEYLQIILGYDLDSVDTALDRLKSRLKLMYKSSCKN